MITDWIAEHRVLAWLAAGLALMVLETIAPGAFMVWIGIASVCTGLATYGLNLGFEAEVVAFAVFAALAIAAGLRLRGTAAASLSSVNMPGSGLVGRRAHALAFEGEIGRVRLGDTEWSARFAQTPSRPVLRGAALDVIGIDGTTLVVRPIA